MGKPRNHIQRMKTRYFELVKEWQTALQEGREADADDLEKRMNAWWDAIKILNGVDFIKLKSDNTKESNLNGK